MTMQFPEAFAWAGEKANDHKPHLLLGNGFSMAYNSTRFGYTALATKAKDENLLPDSALRLMAASGNSDFEGAMRSLEAAEEVLRVLDATTHAVLIAQLHADVERLREALAHSIAGLHPERPYEIDEAPYRRVRTFLDAFKTIYSVNYDLLLYWTLMQDFGDPSLAIRSSDDGFRDSRVPGDETVLWNNLRPAQAERVLPPRGAPPVRGRRRTAQDHVDPHGRGADRPGSRPAGQACIPALRR